MRQHAIVASASLEEENQWLATRLLDWPSIAGYHAVSDIGETAHFLDLEVSTSELL